MSVETRVQLKRKAKEVAETKMKPVPRGSALARRLKPEGGKVSFRDREALKEAIQNAKSISCFQGNKCIHWEPLRNSSFVVVNAMDAAPGKRTLAYLVPLVEISRGKKNTAVVRFMFDMELTMEYRDHPENQGLIVTRRTRKAHRTIKNVKDSVFLGNTEVIY